MVQVGERLPAIDITLVRKEGQETIAASDLFAGKKAVLFALPGAFTAVCSASHLPGFVMLADDIKGQGIDFIACLSVNDPFVMRAWGEQQNAEAITLLADINADFTRAIGVEQERPDLGGVRSRRYSMIVDDGVVTRFNLEQPMQYEVSDAESLLAALKSSSQPL